jgi:hypothetical protein
MEMYRELGAGQNHTKMGNKSFERMEEFKYLEPTQINQNSTLEEITSRLKSQNAC